MDENTLSQPLLSDNDGLQLHDFQTMQDYLYNPSSVPQQQQQQFQFLSNGTSMNQNQQPLFQMPPSTVSNNITPHQYQNCGNWADMGNVNTSYPSGYVNPNYNKMLDIVSNLNKPNNRTEQQLSPLQDVLNMPSDTSFSISEVNFLDTYYKAQSRAGGGNCQRVKDGLISFYIEFASSKERDDVNLVSVKLQRTFENKLEPEKRLGPIALSIRTESFQTNKLFVELNLDCVYEKYGKKLYAQIYSLDRSQVDLNKFHLIIEVHNRNNNISIMNTKHFRMIGKIKKSLKRPHSNSASSTDSTGYNTGSPLTDLSTKGTNDETEIKLLKASEITANHIKTKSLHVSGMIFGKVVQTENGDIAYHFLLQDESQHFEEGEVVGFLPTEEDSTIQVIVKLDFVTASKAVLKGVVSRSQYLEAHVPKEGVISETIAMFGMVPVQTVGSVWTNEALYASPYHPGLAISEHNLDATGAKDASFIGYSFSSRKTVDETSVGMVQAFVSILQSASQNFISEKLHAMNEDIEDKFLVMHKSHKRRKRCCIGISSFTVIFLILLGVFLWQYYVPGTKLRYLICEAGRKKPHGSASFNYIPMKNIHIFPKVNGIEYEYEKLLKNMHMEEYQPITDHYNQTGFRYYKNVDRCAYGKLTETEDVTTGAKRVLGPQIFAVDEKCYFAYYYWEGKKRWQKYNSVSWPKRQNIRCDPPNIMKYKEVIEGDPSDPAISHVAKT